MTSFHFHYSPTALQCLNFYRPLVWDCLRLQGPLLSLCWCSVQPPLFPTGLISKEGKGFLQRVSTLLSAHQQSGIVLTTLSISLHRWFLLPPLTNQAKTWEHLQLSFRKNSPNRSVSFLVRGSRKILWTSRHQRKSKGKYIAQQQLQSQVQRMKSLISLSRQPTEIIYPHQSVTTPCTVLKPEDPFVLVIHQGWVVHTV